MLFEDAFRRCFSKMLFEDAFRRCFSFKSPQNRHPERAPHRSWAKRGVFTQTLNPHKTVILSERLTDLSCDIALGARSRRTSAMLSYACCSELLNHEARAERFVSARLNMPRKTLFSEGYGLKPVHKQSKTATALAA